MSNTIRIRTTPNGNDKYLKVKLDQDYDFIEILSLKLSQEDAYRRFCSDYGVVVGRVIMNNGFGVPNAKVSIFIPIDEVDKTDSVIKGLYPYEIVTDTNSDGVRYNLLPKENDTTNPCYTPIGTFPTKREILDEPDMLKIYCKYYKFTVTSNHAGDFMIFGVPIGSHILHIDADISDIGIISQRPYDLISQGTPKTFFESSTKFKAGKNLNTLPQVKSFNIGVNVQPFWGDLENCEIGITRVDADLNYNYIPSAIFMGSIFGDQEKNSINKNCVPRTKVGEICEQITKSGTIEMIRKTPDGTIEEFNINGSFLIDDDGTWVYQIPMNLDYLVTDEFGNLIPSNDTTIGIPTRTSVRFRIGMLEDGTEGRLRTRAKYLVPNNPNNDVNQIDYNFDEATKDTSFRDLYWNKIYTVSNFISRYQKINLNTQTLSQIYNYGLANPLTAPSSVVGGTVLSEISEAVDKNSTGIKNVDNCVGQKTAFPYNRVNTKTNPIFFIICLVIKIIGFIVGLYNKIVVGLLNSIFSFLGLSSRLACLTVPCETSNGTVYFAPGCSNQDGIDATDPAANYYCGDSANHDCTTDFLVGWDECIALSIASELNLYQFEFYNDWVNGSLYSFLLKYKKKSNDEKFCEYDCEDFSQDPNYSGVGNDCNTFRLIDTCIPCGNDNCQNSIASLNGVREGLIKKYKDELYYAASLHNASYKLFATEIVCLGSVLDCDWQGIPKLQPYLQTTSYKLPPDIQEVITLPNGSEQVMVTGMAEIGGNTTGLFFKVNCNGVHSDKRQVLNIRHMCESFVDFDEAIINPITGVIIQQTDGTLGSNEIDDLGKFFRNSFYELNFNNSLPQPFSLTNVSTDFNTGNQGNYSFVSTADNDTDYINFRGITSENSYSQSNHSYFFYFGLVPSKTALDKMNTGYFDACVLAPKSDLLISTIVVPDINGTSNGSFVFTILGGLGPYTYTISGPNGTITGTANASLTISNQSEPITVDNLSEGIYTISAIDSLGNPVTQTVSIAGPLSLFCTAFVTNNVSSVNQNDGEITITALGGGVPNYSYELYNSNNSLVSSSTNISAQYIISNLPVDLLGYKLIITDSAQNQCITTGLTISGPIGLTVDIVTTDITCNNLNDGKIDINVVGGQPFYTYNTIGPNNFTSTGNYLVNLLAGTYTVTVTDSVGDTVTDIVTIVNPPLINGNIVTTGNGPYTHVVTAVGGTGQLTGTGTFYTTSPTYTATITDDNGCSITITG